MFKILSLFVGGGVGALSRYYISSWVQNTFGSFFPLGTMTVNITGCFIIGFLSYFFSEVTVSPNIRLLVLTGFLGAFTTFSTYSLETLYLLRDNEIKQALLNIFLSNIIGIVMAFLGLIIARTILNFAR